MEKNYFLSRIKNENKHFIDNKFVYDYSLIPENFLSTDKIKIICLEHGIFEQKAANHLNGQKCYKCSRIDVKNKLRKKREQFITEAKKIHNNFYDYSLVDYKNAMSKIKIICPIHGEFEQTPNKHLIGEGCLKCSISDNLKIKTKSREQFITEAKLIHNDFYDYSLVEYVNSKTKVKIICPIHGEFEQSPQHHLRKSNCPLCVIENNVSKSELKIRDFINNNLSIKTINNYRKIIKNNKEIDIFIDSKNIGFEFNGIYNHNIRNKDKYYHFSKFNDCLLKNVKLYHIFEDEYINNIDSVKSFIIKKLMIINKLINIDIFTRKILLNDDKKLINFLENNDKNYIYTLNDDLIYHCLFDENNEIIKCYIINDKTKTIINIVEKNYFVINDNINYFSGYNLMIDLFYDSPLEEKYKHLKIIKNIKPKILIKKISTNIQKIWNCGYIIYKI